MCSRLESRSRPARLATICEVLRFTTADLPDEVQRDARAWAERAALQLLLWVVDDRRLADDGYYEYVLNEISGFVESASTPHFIGEALLQRADLHQMRGNTGRAINDLNAIIDNGALSVLLRSLGLQELAGIRFGAGEIELAMSAFSESVILKMSAPDQSSDFPDREGIACVLTGDPGAVLDADAGRLLSESLAHVWRRVGMPGPLPAYPGEVAEGLRKRSMRRSDSMGDNEVVE